MEMRHIEPKDLSVPEVFGLLVGGVTPRPIALVVTISENGTPNLAPFSFFNAFGANPPVIAFSPCRRVRDGTHKHTYYNLKNTSECTVQLVTYDMVEQVSLASTEYENGINEFIKSGWYYYDSPASVKRSLYMDDVLYTISEKKVKMNDLDDLGEINEIELPYKGDGKYYYGYE